MSSDTERLFELAQEIGHRLTGALRDVVPAEAQHHLLNAQRELLTALFLIYEQQVGARRQPAEPAPDEERGPDESEETDRSPSRRLRRIDVE